jgi:hypothetical protein
VLGVEANTVDEKAAKTMVLIAEKWGTAYFTGE